MKHEPMVTANAVAVTAAIIFVACRLLVGLFPDLMFTIAQSWFHGVELVKSDLQNLTLGLFILGLVSSTVSGWVVGYLFASVYNYFLRGKK